MNTFVMGTPDNKMSVAVKKTPDSNNTYNKKAPEMSALKSGLSEANQLLDDVILKKYLYQLDKLEIVPLDNSMKNISKIRLFRITEMVYQNKEYTTYKLASVFSAVQHLNCGVFLLINSDGEKTDFYMGIRAFDLKRTPGSLKDTLCNALKGQFPGVKTEDLKDSAAEQLIRKIPSKNIVSVSCVAQNKDKGFNDNEKFIQGLEKFALAMQGKKYSAVILAKSIPAEEMESVRNSYETIYTQLSPFANMQMSYGTSEAISISESFSHSTSVSESVTNSTSKSFGKNYSKNKNTNEGTSKQNTKSALLKGIGTAAISIAGIVTAPMTGGASVGVAAALSAANIGLASFNPKTNSKGTSQGTSNGTSESNGSSTAKNSGISESNSNAKTEGTSSTSSENLQLTLQNKSLINTLEKIDTQLKRIDECESIGMWECAAYFLSDIQETAEMAAGTYKSLMKGEKSGIETSAINFWGRNQEKTLAVLRDYITNFIHPVFNYSSASINVSVSPATFISSNELAIHMGLPRQSVCGFPVVKHADFGKEVVSFDVRHPKSNSSSENGNISKNGKSVHFEIGSKENDFDDADKKKSFELGRIFSMGEVTNTKVSLDCNSLTMHTFVTGSTGSGKSNTVYEILYQLMKKEYKKENKIHFLVVEPAKGEYKNVFGNLNSVHVYGTNPKKSDIIRINPFSFNEDIHILEHLDRLVEIFNVCWPMYAAMPAILKDAMERAYTSVGWDLGSSENQNGRKFPNFVDLLTKIEEVVNESEYSSDSKGDYSGALLTRVRSLTNGLNGQIFTRDEISEEDLFDKNVIVDLSRVGSSETKSLIMGLIIMKLNEYRMSSGKINSNLSHVTVLEEAHNILKRTSTEQSDEGSNLSGKSVEMLSNSIAEMRTYGEGFIIADQSPGLLDMSAIRNTNTKIILRLPDKNDRELVGYAAGLNDEQINELSKLSRGVAAVYQNDWVEPVLVQVNKCNVHEEIFSYDGAANCPDLKTIRTNVVHFLIHDHKIFKDEKPDFDIKLIKKWYSKLQLSSVNLDFIESQINKYYETGKLELWDNDDCQSADKITNIIGLRSAVTSCVNKNGSLKIIKEKLVEMINDCIETEYSHLIALFLMYDWNDGTPDKEQVFNDYLSVWND